MNVVENEYESADGNGGDDDAHWDSTLRVRLQHGIARWYDWAGDL